MSSIAAGWGKLRLVTKDEVRQVLDGIPEDVPVLIDEAYHHFVDDPSYATSVPYVVDIFAAGSWRSLPGRTRPALRSVSGCPS